MQIACVLMSCASSAVAHDLKVVEFTCVTPEPVVLRGLLHPADNAENTRTKTRNLMRMFICTECVLKEGNKGEGIETRSHSVACGSTREQNYKTDVCVEDFAREPELGRDNRIYRWMYLKAFHSFCQPGLSTAALARRDA